MPRVGPVYDLPAGYLAVTGETIQPSQHNPPLEDIAQALTDSLPRNGTGPMTGNLAMGGNKITGLAAGTNASDAVRFDQVASSAWLTSVSALALAADEMVYANGTNTAAKTGLTAFARTLLDDVDGPAMLTTLGAQAAGATLSSLEGLSLVAGDILYATGADTLVRLAKGTALQELRMNAGATAPEWATPATPGGMTLLATEPTTGGGSPITVSGLTLTNYKIVEFWFDGVSLTSASNIAFGGQACTPTASAGSDRFYGVLKVHLAHGTWVCSTSAVAADGAGVATPYAGRGSYSTATTSFSFTSTGFDAGNIRVYGVT